MSSDGNVDLAFEYPAGAIGDSPIPFLQELPVHSPVPIVDFATLRSLDPSIAPFVPQPVTALSSASDVAAMFRQLRVHTPAPLTPNGQRAARQANETFTVSFTPAERRGDQTGVGLEPGATTGSQEAMGVALAMTHRQRSNSNGSATAHDLRQCARCGEQNQYCHGHTPVIPNPSLDLPPRLPSRAPLQSDGMARVNLNRAQATALASNLLDALKNHEDAAEVPPAYDYGGEFARIIAEGLGIEEAVAAKGLGIRAQRGQNCNQGQGGRPQVVPDIRCPANPQQAQGTRPPRRPTSPVPAGFEHNRGPAFIPFRIRNEHGGETPARYIHAHLDAPNPFVEGCLSLNGPTYHSEIHTATVHDLDVPPPPITADILQLLDTDYMGHKHVDEALGELSDRSLQAKVNWYRRLTRKRKLFEESIRRLEDQMFTADVERRMCISRLEAARAVVRIQHEMQGNRQAFCLSPWSLECGR
jgi:hypothetical protein